jgi:hypothetical protein
LEISGVLDAAVRGRFAPAIDDESGAARFPADKDMLVC